MNNENSTISVATYFTILRSALFRLAWLALFLLGVSLIIVSWSSIISRIRSSSSGKSICRCPEGDSLSLARPKNEAFLRCPEFFLHGIDFEEGLPLKSFSVD